MKVVIPGTRTSDIMYRNYHKIVNTKGLALWTPSEPWPVHQSE
jgi:hypothetical protein